MLHVFAVTNLILSGFAAPQQPMAPEVWQGDLDLGPAKVTLTLRVTPDEAGPKVLLSRKGAAAAIAVESFRIEGDAVTFEVTPLMASFSGKRSKDGMSVVGTWKQSGQELPLTFRRADSTDAPPEPEAVEVWQGTLQAGPRTLVLRFRIFEPVDGKPAAKFDSLTEGAMGMAATAEKKDGRLFFEVGLLQAKFEGKLNDAGRRAEGNWIQGAARLPLVFERVDGKKAVAAAAAAAVPAAPPRPQTPTGPFRYRVEEQIIPNEEDGVTLSGTLTLPRAEGRYPVAVLISGSGPQDRDETLFHHKPFLVIADYLTRQGIGVFRFDDRGVGKSTGDFSTATSEDFARDVRAIVASLRKHPAVDPDKVGLIGHSEGGLIGPMVAAADPKIAFLVLLAGPGVSGADILRDQGKRVAMAEGVAEADLARDEQLREILFAELLSAPPDADGRKLVERAVEKFLAQLPEGEREAARLTPLQMAQLQQLGSPWFRFFLQHDPAKVLENVHCPVLAINGEKDVQVWHEINLPAIVSALKKGGNHQIRAVRIPSLNHLFQRAESGAVSEYNEIKQTMAPEVLDLMSGWIQQVVGSKK